MNDIIDKMLKHPFATMMILSGMAKVVDSINNLIQRKK